MAILSIIIILTNCTIIGVVVKTGLNKSPNGYFKLHLAITDLLVGIVVVPISALLMIQKAYKPPINEGLDMPSNVTVSSKTVLWEQCYGRNLRSFRFSTDFRGFLNLNK